MNKRSAFSNEVDYGLAIGRRVGRIGDIRDLLAGRYGHDIAKLPKRSFGTSRCRRPCADADRIVVRPFIDHSALEYP